MQRTLSDQCCAAMKLNAMANESGITVSIDSRFLRFLRLKEANGRGGGNSEMLCILLFLGDLAVDLTKRMPERSSQ